MTDQLTWPQWFSDVVNTGNATPTTIATIAIPAGTIVRIVAEVVARRTGGSAGSAEDGAGYRATATYKNLAGTATLIDSNVTAEEDQSGWDVSFSASSGNALIQVTGAANNSVSWRCEYRKIPVTTV